METAQRVKEEKAAKILQRLMKLSLTQKSDLKKELLMK